MSLYKYFELTDNINKGVIARINETNPSKQYEYIPKEKNGYALGLCLSIYGLKVLYTKCMKK